MILKKNDEIVVVESVGDVYAGEHGRIVSAHATDPNGYTVYFDDKRSDIYLPEKYIQIVHPPSEEEIAETIESIRRSL